VAIAHRGFLPSTDDTGTPRPERFAEDALALLDHLGIERAAIVAQSMGGWTALELALRWPDRVRALVMSGTSGSLAPPAGAERSGGAERDLFARGIHPAGGERMAREQPELHHLYRQIASSTGDWDREDVRRALHGLRTRTPEEVAGVAQPLLAIAGEEDIVASPAHVERLAATVPNGAYRPVPRAGHSPYFERADAFNRLVLDFLG
jgi:3-oxoadipate enol-lactonase